MYQQKQTMLEEKGGGRVGGGFENDGSRMKAVVQKKPRMKSWQRRKEEVLYQKLS